MIAPPDAGVAVVIPVRNGEEWLEQALDAAISELRGRRFEILAVEDGSVDGSARILRRYAAAGLVRVIDGPRRGAAAALNAGIRAATCPVICQIDQDVIVRPGWLPPLLDTIATGSVAAAQGYYETPADASIWSRVMGRDLETRYRDAVRRHGREGHPATPGVEVNHVCTGNTVYRAEALHAVGLFDERLGYGYDNDLSYRLTAAGFRLVMHPGARSVHRWRDSWLTYALQQYGFGYGRLDLVAIHRRRLTGDDISPLGMMLHAPLTAIALAGLMLAMVLAAAGGAWPAPAMAAAGLLGALALERQAAGVRAAVAFRDPTPLLFPIVHLVRDIAWAAAIAVWCARRVVARQPRPSHSMIPRQPGHAAAHECE